MVLVVMAGAAGAAEAADYSARARISQFDPFEEDSGPTGASINLVGDHGDPAFPYLVSATANDVVTVVDANANKDNVQVKSAQGEIDDLLVTFSSEINSLASGGSITVKIPFSLTYNVDVPDIPAIFSQGSATVNYSLTGRQQPSDNLTGNTAGLLTLLNSSQSHTFVNQTGAFASATPLEDADETVFGELELSLTEVPGSAIPIHLRVLTISDAGGSGLDGFANSKLTFAWQLDAAQILDASDTPLAASNVDVSVGVPEVPLMGPLGLGVLAVLLSLAGAGLRESREVRA